MQTSDDVKKKHSVGLHLDINAWLTTQKSISISYLIYVSISWIDPENTGLCPIKTPYCSLRNCKKLIQIRLSVLNLNFAEIVFLVEIWSMYEF